MTNQVCKVCGDTRAELNSWHGLSDVNTHISAWPIAGGLSTCGDMHQWEVVAAGQPPVAILSTTILPLDGVYRVETTHGEVRETLLSSLSGVAHYIGHPDTKTLVEALGAVAAPTKLFSGLAVGEAAVCFPIKQGLSSRATNGFTSPHQAIEEIDTLDLRIITRIE